MLEGKTAIVTGSTSGIGLAIAKSLAAKGANILLNGIEPEEELQDELADVRQHGSKVELSTANLMKPDAIAGMIGEAEKDFGSIDILVNNAGIQHVAPIDEFPEGKWDAIIALNLSAAFHTIKHTLPGMKKRGWGRIINTASAHSLVASPYKSAYVTAKHGLAGLTKTVALEVAEQGITCNAISPGYVWTPLVENQIADTAKARGISEDEVIKTVILESQPTKEFVTSEQIGDTAVFLCSDSAAQITGTNLTVDGGWTAQ